MPELDPRTPHERRFVRPSGGMAVFNVDHRGVVEITEELLADLLDQAGFNESRDA